MKLLKFVILKTYTFSFLHYCVLCSANYIVRAIIKKNIVRAIVWKNMEFSSYSWYWFYFIFIFFNLAIEWMYRGCLLVRQSVLDNPWDIKDVGGGVIGVHGFYSSFYPRKGGLSLNMGITFIFFLVYIVGFKFILLLLFFWQEKNNNMNLKLTI